MKRIWSLVFIVIGVLLITGCGGSTDSGTLTCTKTETDEDGYNTDITMVITYEDNMVTKVVDTEIMEYDSDYIEFMVSFGNLIAESLSEVEGFDAEYSQESDTSVKSVVTVDYTTLDLDALKEAYGDDYDDDSYYSSVNQTLDDFKSNNLDGYTCN